MHKNELYTLGRSPKVAVEMDPQMLTKMLLKAQECKAIDERFHEASADSRLGCPEISSDEKIARYLRALQIYDEPSCRLSNATYNQIFRNALQFLNINEQFELIDQMRVEKIGNYNRRE